MPIDVLFPNQEPTINEDTQKYKSLNVATIKVIGVGGAGVNAVNTMIKAKVSDVDFYVVNTDAAVLRESLADNKVQIGNDGLGVGGDPEKGRQAANENIDTLKEIVSGADMVFIATGMGGGTGTGAAPIIAKLAKEMGILTVAVVTKPFSSEGKIRIEHALKGIKEIKQYVDTLIVIPNDNIFNNIDKKTSLIDAFKIIDDVLRRSIESITDTITKTGNIINIDFADVKTVLTNSSHAIIGLGVGETYEDAFQKALTNVFVEGPDIKEANNMLVNISCSNTMPFTLADRESLSNYIIKEFKNINFNKVGAIEENSLDQKIKVSIIASFSKEADIPQDLFANQPQQHIQQTTTTEIKPKLEIKNIDNEPIQNDDNAFSKPAYEFWTLKRLK